MIEHNSNGNSGPEMSYLDLLVLAVLVLIVSYLSSFLISEMTGIDLETCCTWVVGGTALAEVVFVFIVNRVMRFSLVVTSTAILLVATISAIAGGDEKVLDAAWTKAFVTTVSVGVGAVVYSPNVRLKLKWSSTRFPSWGLRVRIPSGAYKLMIHKPTPIG